jgi:5-methylcytosine-specific restriction enzyme A
MKPANEVDHIMNNDNHSLENLQAICPEHHKTKTQQEAQKARFVKIPKRARAGEPHPGMN